MGGGRQCGWRQDRLSSQSIQTGSILPFDARAEPLPELKGLLLLALTLGLNFFLRGFLSHSCLIMLSREPAAPLIPSDSGTGVPALQAEYTRNLLIPQIIMVCDAERDVMEHCESVHAYAAVMLAARTTLPH